jgi:hypothetical protein
MPTLRFISVQAGRVLCLACTLALLLMGSQPSSATAQARSGVAFSRDVPRTLIECRDRVRRRFFVRHRPSRCEVAGFDLEPGAKFQSVLVTSLDWSGWGEFRSRGESGTNARTRTRVRLFAYRRIRCGDGRIFYSNAIVEDLRNSHYRVLRLPVCGDQVRAGERPEDQPLPHVPSDN